MLCSRKRSSNPVAARRAGSGLRQAVLASQAIPASLQFLIEWLVEFNGVTGKRFEILTNDMLAARARFLGSRLDPM